MSIAPVAQHEFAPSRVHIPGLSSNGLGTHKSVDRTGFRDPDALDPEYPAEWVEVMVVVKYPGTASSRCSRDEVVGSGDAPLASQLSRGTEGCRAGAACDMGRGQGHKGLVEVGELLFVAGACEQLQCDDRTYCEQVRFCGREPAGEYRWVSLAVPRRGVEYEQSA